MEENNKRRAAAPLKARVASIFLVINASTILLHVGHGSTSLPSSSSEACVEEAAACYDSALCWDCVAQFAEDGVDSCGERYPAMSNSGASDCDVASALFCCSFYVSGQDCLDDAVTMEFFQCGLEESGCTLSDSDCSAGDSSSTPSASDSAPAALSTSTPVSLLPGPTPAPYTAVSSPPTPTPSPSAAATPATMQPALPTVSQTDPQTPSPNVSFTPAQTATSTSSPTASPTATASLAAQTSRPTASPEAETAAPDQTSGTMAPASSGSDVRDLGFTPSPASGLVDGSDIDGNEVTAAPSSSGTGQTDDEPNEGVVESTSGAVTRIPLGGRGGLEGRCVVLLAVVGAWGAAAVMAV
ncbi:unnamed protein product [Ectocarpus sp. CCAP 1310/34]|nr:unnamed protein product [Ectocarpus sp. CCAP 1310/34]